jgi:hypothetical protein
MHRGAVGRWIAVALLLAAAGASIASRQCLMDLAASAQEAAHDCCAAGIGALPPACCHTDLAPGPKAVLSGKSLVAAPTALPAVWSAPMSRQELQLPDSVSLQNTHGPPPLVLRI